jgi:ribosomal protein S18 acetylase RimI-like enzyme
MEERFFVFEPDEIDSEIYTAIKRLIPQYSTIQKMPSYREVKEIIDSGSTCLFFASDLKNKKIVGSLTLVFFRLPSGIRAIIEDVVVDELYRKKGIGKLLCQAAIDRSVQIEARTIDLTSRPVRKAAHHLYEGIGFAVRDTTVYRYDISNK